MSTDPASGRREPAVVREQPAHAGRSPVRRRLALAAVVVMLAGVGVWFAIPRGPADDLGRLQGEWAVSAYGRPGVVTVRIEGDHWTYRAGGQPGRSYRLTLKPDANPKQIDLAQLGEDGQPVTFTHGGGKGAEVNLHGVYSLDGDTATVVLTPGVKPRPVSFQDTDAQVLNLTRVTK